MTEDQCLKIPEDYLSSHVIEHVRPGQVGSKEQSRWEAIFLNPAVLNPAVAVVDPPDVRIWVAVPNGRWNGYTRCEGLLRVETSLTATGRFRPKAAVHCWFNAQ